MGYIKQDHVFIIAEAGVNHNGDPDTALRLVDAAAAAGADAVKFQTYITDKLVTLQAKQADYQIKNIGHEISQYEMLKELELSRENYLKLVKHCMRKKILFLSTAFDEESIDFLHTLKLPLWKIPSGEITNLPYLRRIGSFGMDIILSTGMATLGEIEAAIDVLEKAGTSRNLITLLQCTTEYPAPFDEVNLRAMNSLYHTFGTKVGYSDHTIGIEIPIAAVALGAIVIEKHFTLDKNLPGPDHKASLNPKELHLMIQSIRNIEKALGSGQKKPTKSELKNRDVARKSIVAARNIKTGQLFTNKNLTTKRPGTGLSPMWLDELMNKKANRQYSKDDIIDIW